MSKLTTTQIHLSFFWAKWLCFHRFPSLRSCGRCHAEIWNLSRCFKSAYLGKMCGHMFTCSRVRQTNMLTSARMTYSLQCRRIPTPDLKHNFKFPNLLCLKHFFKHKDKDNDKRYLQPSLCMPWVGCGWQKKCCPRSESNWGTHHAHSCKQNTITTTPCNLTLTFPFNDIWLATWLQQPFPAHLSNLLVELIICTVVVLAGALAYSSTTST